MENNEVTMYEEIAMRNIVKMDNEIDPIKLPPLKQKVWGTDGDEIEMEKFEGFVDVRFWLPITHISFARILMGAREWELHNEDGYVITKGKNRSFDKSQRIPPRGDDITKFAETIIWSLDDDFTSVMEMSEEVLNKNKPKFLRLIFSRISNGVFAYMDFDLTYIEKPIMVDGKRLFAPLVNSPVLYFTVAEGADNQPVLHKGAYEKWERLLEEDVGEEVFAKMVLGPLNTIKLGTQHAFIEHFHNTVRFNRWYSMPLINFTNVIYSNGKADKDIFKKGRHDDEKKHTYSNNPNAGNFYIFFIEKGELKMVKMDAELYSHLNKKAKSSKA